MRSEYTTSLAPAIQHSCPVIDLVELIATLVPSKTSCMALASLASPANRNVDTSHVLTFLIDDGINRNGCFTCLAVTNNQLTLTTANWHH